MSILDTLQRAFPRKQKTYTVTINITHRFTIDAESEEQAREFATDEPWDMHPTDCRIDVEGGH